MDASHILVAILTPIAVGLLVWAEIRSRRDNLAIESTTMSSSEAIDVKRARKTNP